MKQLRYGLLSILLGLAIIIPLKAMTPPMWPVDMRYYYALGIMNRDEAKKATPIKIMKGFLGSGQGDRENEALRILKDPIARAAYDFFGDLPEVTEYLRQGREGTIVQAGYKQFARRALRRYKASMPEDYRKRLDDAFGPATLGEDIDIKMVHEVRDAAVKYSQGNIGINDFAKSIERGSSDFQARLFDAGIGKYIEQMGTLGVFIRDDALQIQRFFNQTLNLLQRIETDTRLRKLLEQQRAAAVMPHLFKLFQRFLGGDPDDPEEDYREFSEKFLTSSQRDRGESFASNGLSRLKKTVAQTLPEFRKAERKKRAKPRGPKRIRVLLEELQTKLQELMRELRSEKN